MRNALIRLATHLDNKGHYKEANYLDVLISKYAAGFGVGGAPGINIDNVYDTWKRGSEALNPTPEVESGILELDDPANPRDDSINGTGPKAQVRARLHGDINHDIILINQLLYGEYPDNIPKWEIQGRLLKGWIEKEDDAMKAYVTDTIEKPLQALERLVLGDGQHGGMSHYDRYLQSGLHSFTIRLNTVKQAIVDVLENYEYSFR